MKNMQKLAIELAALVEKVKDEQPYRADLLTMIQEILVEEEMAADVMGTKNAIKAALHNQVMMGAPFVAVCAKLGITNSNDHMRVAGAVGFISSEGDEEIAPEILGALETGCIKDPDALAYLLEASGIPRP